MQGAAIRIYTGTTGANKDCPGQTRTYGHLTFEQRLEGSDRINQQIPDSGEGDGGNSS